MKLQQYATVRVPRLHIFVRACRGWVPVKISGTEWDERNARSIYKSLGFCTAWFKVDHIDA